MVYRRRKATRRRKYAKRRPTKTFKRRLRKRPLQASRTRIRGGNGLLSDRLQVKLRYHSGWDKLTASGTFTQIWSGNSIFDPDQTGIGTQPIGYDQYDTLYDRYEVHGCKITVKLINNSETVPFMATLRPTRYTSPVGEPSEQPYTKTRVVGISTGGKPYTTIQAYFNTKKIFGLNKPQSTEGTYISDFGANPSRQWYWNLYLTTIEGGQLLNMFYDAWITYYVTLQQRAELIAS